ncbi:MAG: glycoside hydrolase family 5 protein [Oscillospiraceae bacterium]|nr:glycoside hydrolase family 5 protein [Oscillospiraceae bacterium]
MKRIITILVMCAVLTACSADNTESPVMQTSEQVTVTTAETISVTETTTEQQTTETEEATAEETTEAETTAGTPVAYYGEIIADGNKLVGKNTGEPVRVTGMSFFWSNWSQKYYTADYVDYLVDDYNCEVVRCSYGIQDNGVPYDDTCEPLIEDVINQAIERGVYVIIDWHSHGAHNNPDEAVAYFEQLAEKYGSYDNVIFEIYNEPTQVSWETVKAYAEIVIPAIRKHSDNLVIVGSPTWSQDVVSAAGNPVEGENIAYTLHFYAGTHKQWLRDNGDKALAAGIPLFVTEWGSVNADGNGNIDKASTEEWFAWMDKNNISSCNWSVNDKDETSSIFKKDSILSETGKYIKELISERTKDSPWRNN